MNLDDTPSRFQQAWTPDLDAIIIAEQGRWFTAIIRPLFALPFVIFAWKVVVYDKVLGWGTTDAIDPNMWGVFLAVVGSYFGLSAIDRIAKVFKR